MQTVLNILLMLVSLSILICLHELGHLFTAKLFNVYCAEYSLGMGPLILKIKKPNQETQFSVRVLPVGGYVAMAGEGAEDPGGARSRAPAADPRTDGVRSAHQAPLRRSERSLPGGQGEITVRAGSARCRRSTTCRW